MLIWDGGVRGPTLTVSEPGTYSLQVITDCEDFEVIGRATLESDAEAFEFFVPNVFSPNQDGLNDEFTPSFSDPGAIRAFQLQVFDRWGKLLFESRDPMVGWDGYVKDRLMGTGVYVWRMEWQASSCEDSAFYEESGSVTLVR
jgi:gliding motility-associated-like protein